MQGKINIICGTTACGKTKYAVELAQKINGEVINADSMQVYFELPILTAQPTREEKQDIAHHLYGYASCASNISVAQWLLLACDKIQEVLAKGKTPILVGGTGMYIKSLVYGIAAIPSIPEEIKQKVRDLINNSGEELYELLFQQDPLTAQQLKPGDKQRVGRALEVIMATNKPLAEWQKQKPQLLYPRSDFHLLLLTRPRAFIYENINQRFLDMLDMGALAEVQNVWQKYGDINYPKAHGLPELIKYLKGEMSMDEAIAKSQQNVRNYAKRQTTWFNHQLDFDEKVEL